MAKKLPPYYLLPCISAIIWVAMIVTMFVYWMTTGKPIYSSMQAGQTTAYISDVGADVLKPLFISMGTASVVIFDVGFILERWLRHKGRLIRNTSKTQKVLSGFAIAFSVIGGLGFILLSILDTKHHPALHDCFLGVFIGGYVISAVFVCAEYQRLGHHYPEYRVLSISFWMKLFFIIVEVAFAIAFGALNHTKHWNSAAVVEWIIALFYTFWVLSFIVDFVPAARQRDNVPESGMDVVEAAELESSRAGDGWVGQHDRSGVPNPSQTTNSRGQSKGHELV